MLKIDVSGPPGSGKTAELIRIAAELTKIGKRVSLITEDSIIEVHHRHERAGGNPRMLTVTRPPFVPTPPGEDPFFDYSLTETTTNTARATFAPRLV